jgi:hypothetical protein
MPETTMNGEEALNESPIVSVLVECNGRTYRVIDNLRDFLHKQTDRSISEQMIGRPVLDLARSVLLVETSPVTRREEPSGLGPVRPSPGESKS